jgi:exportin-T
MYVTHSYVDSELISQLQDCQDESINAEATRLSNHILPVMLQFMADEYDDTSSTIFPFLQAVLGSVCFLPLSI